MLSRATEPETIIGTPMGRAMSPCHEVKLLAGLLAGAQAPQPPCVRCCTQTYPYSESYLHLAPCLEFNVDCYACSLGEETSSTATSEYTRQDLQGHGFPHRCGCASRESKLLMQDLARLFLIRRVSVVATSINFDKWTTPVSG